MGRIALDIIVCVKHVLDTAQGEVKIDRTGRSVETRGFVFDINEWDDYALEEAIRIKGKFGGTVTAICVGPVDADRTLRKCLAKGADNAIKISDKRFEGSDGYAIAKILHKVIKNFNFDLILAGVQASDDGYAIVGPMLAELLEIPHVTMVRKIQFNDGFAIVNRELEGGLEEIFEVKLPAVLAVQTGINEPRYVSLMSMRKAKHKEIKVLSLADLGLSENDVGEAGSWVKIQKMFVPPAEKQAQFIRGSPEEVAVQITEILESRGLT